MTEDERSQVRYWMDEYFLVVKPILVGHFTRRGAQHLLRGLESLDGTLHGLWGIITGATGTDRPTHD